LESHDGGRNTFYRRVPFEIRAKNPSKEEIKEMIVRAFCRERGRAGLSEPFPAEGEESDFYQWSFELHTGGDERVAEIFYRVTKVLLPFISPTLSSLLNMIAQLHCPLCSDENDPFQEG
jgi:hypothetical protein